MLLSVPFLFIFSVATFDFVRGTRTVACGHRASRHVAWCAARHAEDDSYPAVPEAAAVRDGHFYDTSTDVTVGASTEAIHNPFSDLFDGVFDLFDLNSVGRGVMPFLTGQVDVDVGTVSQPIQEIRLFPSTTSTATHKVSLRSRPEETPADPIGWWDPFRDIWDKITGLFN
jgi:hypothetical protein